MSPSATRAPDPGAAAEAPGRPTVDTPSETAEEETETGSYANVPDARPPAAPRGIVLILVVIAILLLWAFLSR